MTAVTVDDAPISLGRSVSTARRVRNALATAWMIGSILLVLVPLVIIIVYVVSKGAGVLSTKFLTENVAIVSRFPGGGIGPAILGTLLLTVIASLIAIPLGVLAAVYLNEYGAQGSLARIIRFMADVMTGVPSIVMGLFVALFWLDSLHHGYSTFAGALALAALMLPIVIRSSEEILRLVPLELRQASDALGARRWFTVSRVVLPAALPGIVSGAMLAVARAAGETAPLLFTIGLTYKRNTQIFRGGQTALSRLIWDNAQQPYSAARDRAWGAALTLIAIVLVFTVVSRVVSARFSTLRRA